MFLSIGKTEEFKQKSFKFWPLKNKTKKIHSGIPSLPTTYLSKRLTKTCSAGQSKLKF